MFLRGPIRARVRARARPPRGARRTRPAHLRSFGARRARRRAAAAAAYRRRAAPSAPRRSPPAAAAAAGGAWAFGNASSRRRRGVLGGSSAALRHEGGGPETGERQKRARQKRAPGWARAGRVTASRFRRTACVWRPRTDDRVRVRDLASGLHENLQTSATPQRRAQGDAARLRRDRPVCHPPPKDVLIFRRRHRRRFRPSRGVRKRKRNRTRDRCKAGCKARAAATERWSGGAAVAASASAGRRKK